MSCEIHEFGSLSPNLDGKSVLVTGGTGSFGHGFVEAVLARYRPRRLIVFSRKDEPERGAAVADHAVVPPLQPEM